MIVLGGGIAAAANLRGSGTSSASEHKPARSTSSTSSTAPAPTTTTTDPRVLVQPAAVELPALGPGGLGSGASGPEVLAYQQRLAELHFDPGALDGQYGQGMIFAVHALQKIIGTERTGTIGEAERQALMSFQYPAPLQPDGEADRTELDVAKQVLTLYENYQVRLITTTSTGSGVRYCYNAPRDNPTTRICEEATTPSGRFTFREYRHGWDRSPLGQLYNPFYFNGGIAIHGYRQVPTGPASHGCARIPMHIAEYFHDLVSLGDAVYVFGGTPANILSRTPIPATTTTTTTLAPPPPPPSPPTTPTTTPPTTAPPTSTTTPPGP